MNPKVETSSNGTKKSPSVFDIEPDLPQVESDSGKQKYDHRYLEDFEELSRANDPYYTSMSPVYIEDTPSGCRPRLTRHCEETYDGIPGAETLPRDTMRDAASAGPTALNLQGFASSQVRANTGWRKPIRFADTAIEIANPLYRQVESRITDLKTNIKVTREEVRVLTGSWLTLLQFKNIPTLVLIAFYIAMLFVMLRAEVYCGMAYVVLSFPELVQIKIPDLAWLTPSKIAFSLTASYIFSLFFLLKFIPNFLNPKGKHMFARAFCRVSWVLIAIGPPMFARVLGVAKEVGDLNFSQMSAEPPWTPGMQGFIAVGFFSLVFSSYAITSLLKAAVESLYEVKRIDTPESAHAKKELREALIDRKSCIEVLQQSQSVLDAVKAVEEKLAMECTFAHGSELADVEARKSQAFILPSRN